MRTNIGFMDKALRFVAATALVLFAFSREARDEWFGLAVIAAGYLGFTALVRFCPLYALLKLSTREQP